MFWLLKKKKAECSTNSYERCNKILCACGIFFPNIFLILCASLCTIKCGSGAALFKRVLSWSRIFILRVGKNLLLIVLHLKLHSHCFSDLNAFQKALRSASRINYFRWLLMNGATWAAGQSFGLVSVAGSASAGPPRGLRASWHFSGPQFSRFLQCQKLHCSCLKNTI